MAMTLTQTRPTLRPAGQRGSFLSFLLRLDSLARQRHDLSQLDDSVLQDIGLTRAEAKRESDRRVWNLRVTG